MDSAIRQPWKVISIRDVIFNEETFFDKKYLSPNKELIAHMEEFVARVSLGPSLGRGRRNPILGANLGRF
jgi:hypothetical protein